MFDFEEYEAACEAIREANNKLLDLFEKDLELPILTRIIICLISGMMY